jgi:hypothetical protein
MSRKQAPVTRAARNPPAGVARAISTRRGALMSREVLSISYYHLESAQDRPYKHVFDNDGVEMYGMPDGSIVIRHPTLRLWEDRLVEDGA